MPTIVHTFFLYPIISIFIIHMDPIYFITVLLTLLFFTYKLNNLMLKDDEKETIIVNNLRN